ncbi:ArpU family phage packaging/lysis transcriptional regulator, partial [Streptococcus suis]
MIFLDTMIDEKKTITITKLYLKQYPRLKTIAHTATTLQIICIVSYKVRTGTTRNTQEDRLLNAIAVSQEVEEIEQAIS